VVEDRWYRYALPLLEYVHKEGRFGVLMPIGGIADALQFDSGDVAAELDRLCRSGYIAGEVHRTMTGGDPRPWFLQGCALAGRGLRSVGAWPSEDPYDALLQLLDRKIEETDEPGPRSKLKALKCSASDVGRATVAGLLVELARGTFHF
jgi:hypothetical protein